MYKYKGVTLNKCDVRKIKEDIILTLENFNIEEIENLKEVDYFVENILYIQKGRKGFFELLAYTKYKLGEYLLSFKYGIEGFKFNKNSIGIIYCILSLLKLSLYKQAYFIFIDNKEKIVDIINSNKSKLDDIIDILIYFNIDITLIDDVSNKIDNLKDKRKKYIYILMNLIRDRKNSFIKSIDCNTINDKIINDYKVAMSDIPNILSTLDLHQLSDICKLKLENNDDINIEKLVLSDNIEKYIYEAVLNEIDFKCTNKNYIPNKISKYDFKDENIKIISYKSKSLVSMHVLKIEDEYIIIDCGAEISNLKIKKIDVKKFLFENNIPIEKVKSIIISHAHLDHYGSLDCIQEYIEKIYMTKDTYNIIDIVSKNIEINHKKIKIKKEYDEFYVGKLKVKFFPTNHIKGSIGVSIKYNNINIVYTGDYSFNNQSTTKHINEKDFYEFQNSDYLIIESTFGYKNMELPYNYNKKLFNYFVNLSVKNNKKVIIPCFSIGKAQECYDLITKSTIKANVLVDGLAIKVNDYYKKIEKNICINNNLNYKNKTIEERYYENDVIIVSSGVINDISLAEKYYQLALEDKNMVTILKCGNIDKNILDKKIKPYDTININLIDISLSSHAHYEDLIKTINTIKPKNLIMVHGKGIKLYENYKYEI